MAASLNVDPPRMAPPIPPHDPPDRVPAGEDNGRARRVPMGDAQRLQSQRISRSAAGSWLASP